MSLKIMVVNDEPLTARVIRSLAVPLGNTVLAFNDSAQASQQARSLGLDLIFVGLPRPDGFELACEVQKSRGDGKTTVVMLSAEDDAETCRKAFDAGASFVLPKPLVGARIVGMLAALETPGWRTRRHAARLALFTEVNCKLDDREFPMRSLNISESGMLLQSTQGVEIGREVSLEFKIAEVRASLRVRARVVRKQGTNGVGVEFTGLAPEEQNAIQLYVMGRAKEKTSDGESSDHRVRRFWTSQT